MSKGEENHHNFSYLKIMIIRVLALIEQIYQGKELPLAFGF